MHRGVNICRHGAHRKDAVHVALERVVVIAVVGDQKVLVLFLIGGKDAEGHDLSILCVDIQVWMIREELAVPVIHDAGEDCPLFCAPVEDRLGIGKGGVVSGIQPCPGIRFRSRDGAVDVRVRDIEPGDRIGGLALYRCPVDGLSGIDRAIRVVVAPVCDDTLPVLQVGGERRGLRTGALCLRRPGRDTCFPRAAGCEERNQEQGCRGAADSGILPSSVSCSHRHFPALFLHPAAIPFHHTISHRLVVPPFPQAAAGRLTILLSLARHHRISAPASSCFPAVLLPYARALFPSIALSASITASSSR